MTFFHKVLFMSAIILTSSCADQDEVSTKPLVSDLNGESPEQWFADGQQELQNAISLSQNTNQAKNIILFIGDGMGVSTVTAARILDGQIKGKSGEENTLSFERLPYLAHSKVYNTNQQVPDSAGTMTAMMSGIKTKSGVIGLNQYAVRGDCDSSKGTETVSLLEQAEQGGFATGIISTARITHATPAATYAHSAERDWESWAFMPVKARNAGCKDIADQLVNFSAGDGIDVAMGGGRRHFLPREDSFNSGEQSGAIEGVRNDGRNLTEEWQNLYPEGRYIIDQAGFDAVDAEKTTKLFGLFNEFHMQYENERQDDILGEPSLSEMTLKAINILNNNPKGFFLMVEGGRIDLGHHVGSAHYALAETIEFAKAVKVALDNTNTQDTLVIVAADHSNPLTIAGYATRGNPILGKVVGNNASGYSRLTPSLATDGRSYTTLGYANGLGFAEYAPGDTRYDLPPANGRHDLSNVDTEDAGYHQEAMIPMGDETHSGEDVAVYAGGPWAHLFRATHEQNYIYHVMSHAMGFNVEVE